MRKEQTPVTHARLVKLPHYWGLPRREREGVRRLVRKIERRLADQEAEATLYEWLEESVMQDVDCELPFSLSVRRIKSIQAYANAYQDCPQFQENPARFYRVYQRAFRSAQRLFRETRSIWEGEQG